MRMQLFARGRPADTAGCAADARRRKAWAKPPPTRAPRPSCRQSRRVRPAQLIQVAIRRSPLRPAFHRLANYLPLSQDGQFQYHVFPPLPLGPPAGGVEKDVVLELTVLA